MDYIKGERETKVTLSFLLFRSFEFVLYFLIKLFKLKYTVFMELKEKYISPLITEDVVFLIVHVLSSSHKLKELFSNIEVCFYILTSFFKFWLIFKWKYDKWQTLWRFVECWLGREQHATAELDILLRKKCSKNLYLKHT